MFTPTRDAGSTNTTRTRFYQKESRKFKEKIISTRPQLCKYYYNKNIIFVIVMSLYSMINRKGISMQYALFFGSTGPSEFMQILSKYSFKYKYLLISDRYLVEVKFLFYILDSERTDFTMMCFFICL